MRRASVFLLLLFLPLLIAATSPAKKHKAVLFPSGTKMKLEVADTESARQKGLMFREHLPHGTGMLFVFPIEAPHRFWMKNCQFPIDIIWLSSGKQVVFIAQSVPPCKNDPCPDYGPKDQSALYVIETSAGFIRKEKLKMGMSVRF